MAKKTKEVKTEGSNFFYDSYCCCAYHCHILKNLHFCKYCYPDRLNAQHYSRGRQNNCKPFGIYQWRTAKVWYYYFQISWWWNTPFAKRIIALPGETIEVKNGIVYITDKNGNKSTARTDFITNCIPTGNFGPYTIPLGSYFVMGDNRNDSWDSRYWDNKTVKKKNYRKSQIQIFSKSGQNWIII